LGGRSITGASGGLLCRGAATVVRVATGGGEQRKDGAQKRNEETVAVLGHDQTLPTVKGFRDVAAQPFGDFRNDQCLF
jgi:hypothetical protein